MTTMTNAHAEALGGLLQAADALCNVIDSGDLFAGYDGDPEKRETAVAAIDRFDAARVKAHQTATPAVVVSAPRLPGRSNPFAQYRNEILGGYSTGQRLATLVLHLYNGNTWVVDLPSLLGSADERHVQIALECQDWYGRHGENCPVFMALAREILRRDHPELCDE